MAQKIHLSLQIDGNDIEGESTIASMDREGTIECVSFFSELTTPRETATGSLTGRRQHAPLTIVKRIDKTTPLLFKALAMNEPITSGIFRFYRPSSSGSGQEEQYYTVLIENGYVASVRQEQSNILYAESAALPMMERVSFIFQDITWTYEDGGATHKDSWAGEA
jgi:type VI secretion system secreted protein Hcp